MTKTTLLSSFAAHSCSKSVTIFTFLLLSVIYQCLIFGQAFANTNAVDKNVQFERILSPILMLLEEEVCDGDPDDLENVDSLTTFSVICEYDLSGRTINLQPSVTLQYAGGSIFNGTMSFIGNSKIDGELLNYQLDVLGSPSLTSSEFNFDKIKWGIIEGSVPLSVATLNKDRLQTAIDLSKRLGANIFNISRLDAYFDTSWIGGLPQVNTLKAIRLPSDFHFKLDDSTHLRMQPSHFSHGTLIRVIDKENVTISGGHLHGDRFEHDYSPINDHFGRPRNTHEWSNIMIISGSHNVLADNIHFYDATADALIFGSSGRRTDPNQRFNKNVTLRNSVITRSRRNGISINDGENLKVLNSHIVDTGLGEFGNTIISSAGVDPRYGIDVEPFTGYTDEGEPIPFEKVDGALIDGNTFINNSAGSLIDYSGNNVVISNNVSDHTFAVNFAYGTQFINNTINARNLQNGGRVSSGINLGSISKLSLGKLINLPHTKDYVVRGNRITNTATGIEVSGNGGVIEGNDIRDVSFSGIFLTDSRNFEINANTISLPKFNHTKGITAGVNASARNITFNDMIVHMPRTPVSFIDLNTSEEDAANSVVFKDSVFRVDQTGYRMFIKNSVGVEFHDNDFVNTDLNIENSTVVQSGNQILPNP